MGELGGWPVSMRVGPWKAPHANNRQSRVVLACSNNHGHGNGYNFLESRLFALKGNHGQTE